MTLSDDRPRTDAERAEALTRLLIEVEERIQREDAAAAKAGAA